MKNKIIITVLIIASLFIFYSTINALNVKNQEKTSENGRYAVSTSYRDAGNWVFVTIIDTQTDEIVKQERFGGFDKYKENE